VKLTAKKREFEDAKLKHRAKPNGASENAAAPAQALQVQPKPAKRLLSACIVEYLAETKEHKEPKTYAAYSKSVLSFAEMMFSVPEHKGLSLARARALYIEDLTRKQAMAWIAELKGKGNQPPHSLQPGQQPQHLPTPLWPARAIQQEGQAQVHG
jgi:hypothetical protein